MYNRENNDKLIILTCTRDLELSLVMLISLLHTLKNLPGAPMVAETVVVAADTLHVY